jgi:predicted transcriptional regulator
MRSRSAASNSLSEIRWRTERISMRLHGDLKRALEYLAEADRRTLSQYVEFICLEHVRKALRNDFDDDGTLATNEKKEFSRRKAHI